MKREIKFRAWHYLPEKMTYGVENAIGNTCFAFGHLIHDNDVEVMQFTGLKDKNGIEIYEGDIVKIEFKEAFNSKNYINISEVIWSESSLRWDVPVYNEAKHGLPLNWGGYESLEIIGNIHENKELLC